MRGKNSVGKSCSKTEKLLEFEVDLGFETRKIVSGVALQFEPETLIDKKVTVLVNLAPQRFVVSTVKECCFWQRILRVNLVLLILLTQLCHRVQKWVNIYCCPSPLIRSIDCRYRAPSISYGEILLPKQLLHEGICQQRDFHSPNEATLEEVCQVHNPDYVHRLKTEALTPKKFEP